MDWFTRIFRRRKVKTEAPMVIHGTVTGRLAPPPLPPAPPRRFPGALARPSRPVEDVDYSTVELRILGSLAAGIDPTRDYRAEYQETMLGKPWSCPAEDQVEQRDLDPSPTPDNNTCNSE